jgi:hypothetical protein
MRPIRGRSRGRVTVRCLKCCCISGCIARSSAC